MQLALAQPSSQFSTVIEETTDSTLEFNVMSERPVRETLHIKRYRIGERCITAEFDHSDVNSMLKSPSHLIFLSALIHSQKLMYVYACHKLGLECDLYGPEVLKICPTNIEVQMTRMLRNEIDLVHTAHIESFECVAKGHYYERMRSNVNDCEYMNGETAVYLQ